MEHNIEYQRIEQLKKFLQIEQNTELARIIGVKNSQIFSEIKRGKNHISKGLCEKICKAFPNISYEWLMTGNGTMLAGGDTNVANNSNNTSATISVGNIGAEPTAYLSLFEKQQAERERLLNIIEQQQTQINLLITKSINQ